MGDASIAHVEMSAPTDPTAYGIAGDGNSEPAGVRATMRALWIVAGGVVIAWSAHNVLLLPWEIRHVEPAVLEPVLVLLRAIVWMVPALLYLRRHDRRRPLVALGVTAPVNLRGLAKSAVAAAIYLTLLVMLVRATVPPEATLAWAALAPLPVVYELLKAALEELFMRGFLLGQLVRFTSSFRARASVAVLFALMHLPIFMVVQDMSIEALLPSMIVVLVLGIVLGELTRASNNVAPAIVLHFVNNLIAGLAGG